MPVDKTQEIASCECCERERGWILDSGHRHVWAGMGAPHKNPWLQRPREGLRPVGGGEARMTSREARCRDSPVRPGSSGSEIRALLSEVAVKSPCLSLAQRVGPWLLVDPELRYILSTFDSRILADVVSLCQTRLNATPSSFGTPVHAPLEVQGETIVGEQPAHGIPPCVATSMFPSLVISRLSSHAECPGREPNPSPSASSS